MRFCMGEYIKLCCRRDMSIVTSMFSMGRLFGTQLFDLIGVSLINVVYLYT